MQKLKLTLFGSAAASIHNQPLHFRTDKIRALLVYLVMEGERPHERQSLAALLWPEMPEETALKNLRQSLHRLQTTLDDQLPGLSDNLFTITRRTVICRPESLDVDALAFQDLLSACEAHPHRHLHLCHDCLNRLTEAAGLYRGELLAGVGLPDAFPFEEWLLFSRERLHNQAVSALGQLATALVERGDLETAIAHAHRLASMDPFREEAHRLLMRLYVRRGEFGKALEQYETCRRVLRDELGVDPAAETTALYRQIRAEQQDEPAGEAPAAGPALLHHFPVQFTPFVGRERELGEIEEWFLDPDSRLLTLVGPGGVGKTRLAVRAGEQLAARGGVPDGIFFFPLASARTVEALLTSLLNGLGAVTSARSSELDSLTDHLRARRCLLVLDNFDQLADSSQLLGELLAAAPGLRLLVASQIPLGLRAERRLTVSGLDFPAEGDPAADPMGFSAVRLFVESARQTDASFRLNAETTPPVLKICRLVEGLPLALELAAAWVRVMDCETIAREVGRSLEFLSLSPQDQPGRHRSMAAVFAYSWQLLPPAEQAVLAQLAVFRGPFSLDAAMAITAATPLSLARLLDRSLLQRRKDGRYELHELLRQFAGQQAGGRTADAAKRHCDYFLDLVAEQERAFYGPQPRRAIAAVQKYLSNIRQAWRWAVENGYLPAVERSLEGIGRFYQVAALIEEGEASFQHAIAVLGDTPALTIWRAFFLSKLGRHSEAVRLAEGVLAQPGLNGNARAEVQSLLGDLLPRDGQFAQARSHLQQAIEFFQSRSDLERLAKSLRRMVSACWRAGDHEATLHYFQQAIPIHEAIEEKRGLAMLYNLLAGFHYEKNEVPQALTYVQKARELYEAIDDKLDAAVINANLARIHSRQGRFVEALAANQQAMDISRDLGDRSGLERDLSHHGTIYAALGDFDRSLNFYFRAIDIAQERNDHVRIADFQAGAAAVYAMRGDDANALAYFDLALPVLLAHGTPYHLAGPLLGKAELLFRKGEWTAARTLCSQAAALAEGTELAEYLVQSRVLAARLDFVEGNRSAGLRQLTDLLASGRDETEQAAIRYALWQLTRDRSTAEEALAVYRQAYRAGLSFVNRSRLEELQEYLEKYPSI